MENFCISKGWFSRNIEIFSMYKNIFCCIIEILYMRKCRFFCNKKLFYKTKRDFFRVSRWLSEYTGGRFSCNTDIFYMYMYNSWYSWNTEILCKNDCTARLIFSTSTCITVKEVFFSNIGVSERIRGIIWNTENFFKRAISEIF